MTDPTLEAKTKQQLIAEVEALRQKLADLENASAVKVASGRPDRFERPLEERERAIARSLRSVVEAANELVAIHDVDTFYRRAVELAREKLGVERCSIFVIDPTGDHLLGTYGTDEHGLTADERNWPVPFTSVDQELFRTGAEGWLFQEVDHRSWDGSTQGRTLSKGWIAETVIRAGDRPLAVFFNDTAITRAPLDPIQQETIGLYCSLLGNILERKRREVALRESEARLRLALAAAQMGTWELNFRTSLLTWSADPRRLFGIPGQVAVEDFLAVVHPEDRAQVRAATTRSSQGAHFDQQYRILRPDGMIRWVISVGQVYTDDDGQPARLVGVTQDITERKQTAEALVEERNLLRTVIDILPDNIFVKDVEGRFLLNNAVSLQMLGVSRQEEALGKDDFDFWPRELAEHSRQHELAILQSGQPMIEQEEFQPWQSDAWRWLVFSTIPLRDEQGAVVGLVGMTTDITERKRAEEALRASEESARAFQERLRKLHEVNLDISTARTLDELCYLAVELATRELGFERLSVWLIDEEQIISGTYGTDESGHVRDEHHVRVELTDESREMQLIEGGIRARLWNDVPLKGAGKIVGQGWDALAILWDGTHGIGLISTDNYLTRQDPAPYTVDLLALYGNLLGYLITRKRAEAEIRALNAELEQRVAQRTAQLEAANKELEAFAYSVSHDLRAPLRAMDGFAHTLVQNYSDSLPEKGQHYLSRIQQNAQRLGLLIDDLLALSRIGRKDLNKERLDMNQLLQTLLAELAADNLIAGTEIVVNDLPACSADGVLLKQVWYNLITNAVKYSKKKEHPRAEIGCEIEADHRVSYFIKDNGVGFDMRYADKLFGVFQRLHSAQDYEGAGIGLAIVQRIIHRHGGHVWANAEIDQGATFHFSLENSADG